MGSVPPEPRERGAIIRPFGDALGVWMDEKPLEAQRLLEKAATWPVAEDNQGAVKTDRLLLDLMRECDPEGQLKLQPRRRAMG